MVTLIITHDVPMKYSDCCDPLEVSECKTDSAGWLLPEALGKYKLARPPMGYVA